MVDYIQVADEKKLKAIYTLLDAEIVYKSSLQQYNNELNEPEAEIEAGNHLTQAQVAKLSAK